MGLSRALLCALLVVSATCSSDGVLGEAEKRIRGARRGRGRVAAAAPITAAEITALDGPMTADTPTADVIAAEKVRYEALPDGVADSPEAIAKKAAQTALGKKRSMAKYATRIKDLLPQMATATAVVPPAVPPTTDKPLAKNFLYAVSRYIGGGAAAAVAATLTDMALRVGEVLERISKVEFDACAASATCMFVHYTWMGNPSTKAYQIGASAGPNQMATSIAGPPNGDAEGGVTLKVVYWRSPGAFGARLDDSIIERQIAMGKTVPAAGWADTFLTPSDALLKDTPLWAGQGKVFNSILNTMNRYAVLAMAKDLFVLGVIHKYGGIAIDTSVKSPTPDMVATARASLRALNSATGIKLPKPKTNSPRQQWRAVTDIESVLTKFVKPMAFGTASSDVYFLDAFDVYMIFSPPRTVSALFGEALQNYIRLASSYGMNVAGFMNDGCDSGGAALPSRCTFSAKLQELKQFAAITNVHEYFTSTNSFVQCEEMAPSRNTLIGETVTSSIAVAFIDTLCRSRRDGGKCEPLPPKDGAVKTAYKAYLPQIAADKKPFYACDDATSCKISVSKFWYDLSLGDRVGGSLMAGMRWQDRIPNAAERAAAGMNDKDVCYAELGLCKTHAGSWRCGPAASV